MWDLKGDMACWHARGVPASQTGVWLGDFPRLGWTFAGSCQFPTDTLGFRLNLVLASVNRNETDSTAHCQPRLGLMLNT